MKIPLIKEVLLQYVQKENGYPISRFFTFSNENHPTSIINTHRYLVILVKDNFVK